MISVDGKTYLNDSDVPEIFRTGRVRVTGSVGPLNQHSYEADDISVLSELPKYCGTGSKCLFLSGSLATYDADSQAWKVVG